MSRPLTRTPLRICARASPGTASAPAPPIRSWPSWRRVMSRIFVIPIPSRSVGAHATQGWSERHGWGAMLRFLASRLATVVLMALLSTLVIFLIANTVPGDPVLAQLGDVAASDPKFVAVWRAKYGLDLPLWDRYFVFLRG